MACLWQERQYFVHFLLESEVEHLVGFVEDEGFDAAEVDGLGGDEFEEASGGGDEDEYALECDHLGVDGDAAEDCEGLDGVGEGLGECLEDFSDLDGEFAGGDEDEDLDVAVFEEAGGAPGAEDGQDEAGGLAGACLGDA